MLPPPPGCPLFPYTTLFRSWMSGAIGRELADPFELYARQSEESRQAAAAQLGVSPEELLTKAQDRKSTRLNSSHVAISYAVFCLKKKNINDNKATTSLCDLP